MPNYIAFAIPFFFALIGLELWVARRQGRRLYRFNDSIADLGCGISQQVTGVFIKGVFVAIYVWAYSLAPLRLEGWAAALVGFLGVDFAYYWWHRASHRVALLWATHAPHHQSQEYNLSVALRQAWFSEPGSFGFYLPLAFLGLSPAAFVFFKSFSTLYQFWIHTRTVGKLHPAFEWLFNTPAHHRVHHGINPRYLDKNYAATLIVWDRLFGTFEPETEEAVYGTVEPFRSWNPIWANFEYLGKVARASLAQPRAWDRLRTWWMPPGWTPQGGGFHPPAVDPARFVKWDTPAVSPGLRRYILFQFVVTTALTTAFLFYEARWDWPVRAGVAAFILAALLTWSGFFEGRRWAPGLEAARLTAGTAGVAALLLLG
jgi:sterol desaturase/sphingolipid hydroxylase (fatty acid hydroxylase superfamily)